MIQRIQSLFLLLASAGFLGQFATDFAQSDAAMPVLMADKVYEVQDHIGLLIITVAGAMAALVGIFLFEKRSIQLKIALLTLILSVLLPVVAFLLLYNEQNAILQDGMTEKAGSFLPLVSLAFSALAMRFISKDDKLVKSMDRLR
jgi:hypothetical protein